MVSDASKDDLIRFPVSKYALFWVLILKPTECVAQSFLKMQCLALWLLWSAVRSLLGIHSTCE